MKRYLLIATGILFSLQVLAQTGLKNGAAAPDFTAKGNSGKTLDLKALLSYVYFDKDYTRRASVSSLLKVLK
ncbi:MAG: AhpC/TSA family protein [Mucilaginibacter sp.]|nr:AhpC/TSA family protein [Mucilaginibacter sp.]